MVGNGGDWVVFAMGLLSFWCFFFFFNYNLGFRFLWDFGG